MAVTSALGWMAACVGLAMATPQESPAPGVPSHIQDDLSVLGDAARKNLETMLREHEQLTGERIVVAVLREGEDNPAAAARDYFTRKLMPELGRQGLGAAIVLTGAGGEAAIEAGVGLEALLGEETRRDLIKRVLGPGVRAGATGPAIARTVAEILRAIESPLVASGRADELLDGVGLAETAGDPASGLGWLAAVLLATGIGGIAFAVVAVGGPEIHCSSEGTHRLGSHERLGITMAAWFSKEAGSHGGESNGRW